MYSTLKASAALALLISHTPAYAQEAFDLGEITLFSSSVPTELSKTGTTTEVVTEEVLQDGGTQQIITKIDALAGVTFAGNGPAGALQTVSLRGLPAKYVPVYFEGIDMTDTTATQNLFNWGGIFNTGIGRVEVLKGSQSALYGSKAIGGVINLAAARLEENGQRYSFGAEYGSFNTKSASFNYLQKTDRADISLSLSRFKTDGFSAADENEGNTEADFYEGTTAILNASVETTDRVTLGGTLFYNTSDSNVDNYSGAGGDGDRPYSNSRRAARAFAVYEGDLVNHEFSISYDKSLTADPLAPSDMTPNFEGGRTGYEYHGNTNIGLGTFSFGVSHQIESAAFAATPDGNNPATKMEAYSSSVFSEFTETLSSNVDMSLAARIENHSMFGSGVTWRGAIAWRPAEATVVRTSLGTGFRAPSLYELFGPYGNSSLDEERSVSFDLGIEHSYSSGSLVKAAVFYNKIDNLIGFAGSSYSQVSGESTTKGVELSGEYVLSDTFGLTGSYTYTDSSDASGNQLKRVPEHDLALGSKVRLSPRLAMGADVKYVAGRADDGYPSRAMPDYTVANATLNYGLNDSADLYLRVENLFDKEYQTSAGYATSDRALYFGVRASF